MSEKGKYFAIILAKEEIKKKNTDKYQIRMKSAGT